VGKDRVWYRRGERQKGLASLVVTGRHWSYSTARVFEIGGERILLDRTKEYPLLSTLANDAFEVR
jgi:hypothetical protein